MADAALYHAKARPGSAFHFAGEEPAEIQWNGPEGRTGRYHKQAASIQI
jgi:hypothetical protein